MNKTGPGRLGFAALLKFFQAEGRFPGNENDVWAQAVQHLVRQTKVGPTSWADYDRQGRTIKYHRAEIRSLFGFREATAEDSEAVMPCFAACAHKRKEFGTNSGNRSGAVPGATSSSDGQRFRASGRGEQSGQVNLRYGNEPGVLFYTHISDQYMPFYTKVIAANARDATHVLDGLLYHESDLRIEEHYTDTEGFTDHVFALCHLLGFRFAPASATSPTSGFMHRARSATIQRLLR